MPIVSTPPVYLVDPSGQQWALSVADGGAPIITTPTSGQQAFAALYLNDVTLPNQTWRFSIIGTPAPIGTQPGDISIEPVSAYNPSAPAQILVNSPDGWLWGVQISDGELETANGVVVIQCLPPIGSLLYPNWNGIAWSQPGGVGTQVFPAPNDGSFGYPVPGLQMQESGSGLWTAGCLHWFDEFLIFRGYDICTKESAALQCCPVCSFLVRTYEPYEIIFDSVQFPILV